jgi:hypothetical protein
MQLKARNAASRSGMAALPVQVDRGLIEQEQNLTHGPNTKACKSPHADAIHLNLICNSARSISRSSVFGLQRAAFDQSLRHSIGVELNPETIGMLVSRADRVCRRVGSHLDQIRG